jgi:peroxiredoxin
MSKTIRCPECSAALEVPDELPAGKRLQCPDCEATFGPPNEADMRAGMQTAPAAKAAATAPPRPRPRHHDDDDDAPARRRKTGSVGLLLAVALILFLGLGAATASLLTFLHSKQQEREAQVALQDLAAQKAAGGGMQGGAPVGMGGGMAGAPPNGMAGGGVQGGVPNGGMAGGPPNAIQGGVPAGGGPGGPVAMPPPPMPLKVGEVAPEIEGEDIDGKPMKLSDFRGKGVVLDFWGDWCPHCKGVYPYQNNLVRRMKDESFVLLGVNNDETRELAKEVVKNHKISWRSWYDGRGQMVKGVWSSGPICTNYHVDAVPTTFVIDKKGVIRQVHIGVTPEAILDHEVDEALAAGEKRAPNAPPRWEPGSTAFAQLGDEVEVGAYRLRPPAGFSLQRQPAGPGGGMYLWKGPPRPDGTAPELEVVLSPAQPDDKKLEDVLEKRVASIPSPRVGWGCGPAERGEVKGLTFLRARWNLLESPQKWKASGVVYVANDGDTLIRMSSRDSTLLFGNGLDAAPLTFHKARK